MHSPLSLSLFLVSQCFHVNLFRNLFIASFFPLKFRTLLDCVLWNRSGVFILNVKSLCVFFCTVVIFYHSSVITDEGSKPEILSRIAQTTAALTKLKPVWNDKYFSQPQDTTDAPPCQFIFLYACESWTLTAKLQRRIQAMEMRCYRKILRRPQRPCYQRGSPCQDPAGNRTYHTKTSWPP